MEILWRIIHLRVVSNHSNVGKAMPSMPFAPSPRKITIFIGGINLNHSQSWAVYGIVLTIVTTVSMSGMRIQGTTYDPLGLPEADSIRASVQIKKVLQMKQYTGNSGFLRTFKLRSYIYVHIIIKTIYLCDHVYMKKMCLYMLYIYCITIYIYIHV